MKKNFSKLVVMAMMLISSTSLFAQSNRKEIKELNEVLSKSLYKTEISLDKDGNVNRIDINGNTFVFNLKDVKEIKADNDGFQNLLIVMKQGRKSKGVIKGKAVESELNVIAFKNVDACKRAIELFNKLIE